MENTGQAPEAPQSLDTDGAADVLLERFQKKIDKADKAEEPSTESVEETAEPVDAAPEEGQAEETEEAPAEEVEAEMEWDGKKFKVKGADPKEIQNALLRQADYSRKTMSLSEERNALAAMRQATEERLKVQEETLSQKAQLFALQSQYQNVVNALPQLQGEDRTAALAQLEQLRFYGGQFAEAISAKEKELEAKSAAEKMATLQRGDAFLRQELPGWGTPDVVRKIVSAGRALGASDKYLADSVDPILMKALHKAALYDELQARKPQITKRVAEAPKGLKPGPGNQQTQGNKTRREEADARLRKSGRLDDAANAILARIVKGRR